MFAFCQLATLPPRAAHCTSCVAGTRVESRLRISGGGPAAAGQAFLLDPEECSCGPSSRLISRPVRDSSRGEPETKVQGPEGHLSIAGHGQLNDAALFGVLRCAVGWGAMVHGRNWVSMTRLSLWTRIARASGRILAAFECRIASRHFQFQHWKGSRCLAPLPCITKSMDDAASFESNRYSPNPIRTLTPVDIYCIFFIYILFIKYCNKKKKK